MNDKLNQYCSENEFDLLEPSAGHEIRFEQKLNRLYKKEKTSWKWLSVAASVVLILGFWFGSNFQNTPIKLADVSPKMEEVENYFISTINQEIRTLEKYRSLETETIIEQALNQLEELEDDYRYFLKDLKTNGYKKEIISAMIKNYQKRLEILENVFLQINQIKKIKDKNYEIYL